MTKGPVLIDLEGDAPVAGPDIAPPVPDVMTLPEGRAMQTLAALSVRKPSRLARWFWSLLLSLVGVFATIAAWDFVTELLVRAPILGWIVTGVLVLLGGVMLLISLRELAAFSRLKRIDVLHRDANISLLEQDLNKARQVVKQIKHFYKGREDTRWGRDRLAQYEADQFDAESLLGLVETEVLAPLDAAALTEIEGAARRVALVTAIVPLALADVVAALTSNIRMIRRVAEIYGGRSGVLGSWRLARAVMAHLVATGAVSIGDDMIGTLAGGGILSKLSRRFGEGIVNGALTARVGVAAMDVCRPLPFNRAERPSVTGVVKRALTGLFGQA